MRRLVKMRRLLLLLFILPLAPACRPGQFGSGCHFNCHCSSNALCDANTGACNSPCASGWFGPACQVGNIIQGKQSNQSSTPRGIAQSPGCTDTGRNTPVTSWYGQSRTSFLRPGTWWQVDLGSPHVIYRVKADKLGVDGNSIYGYKPNIIIRVSHMSVHIRGPPIQERTETLLNGSIVRHEDPTVCARFAAHIYRRRRYGYGYRPDINEPFAIDCRRPLRGRILSIEIEPEERKSASLKLCGLEILGYQECQPGGRGPGCLNECRCSDTNECDIFGWCRSGCKFPFLGKFCEREFRISAPNARRKTENRNRRITSERQFKDYITVEKLPSTDDSMRGSVIRQVLQFKAVNDTEWRELMNSNISANSSQPMMYNLLHFDNNQTFEFRVKVAKPIQRIRLNDAANGTLEVVLGVSDVVRRCRIPPALTGLSVVSGPVAAEVRWHELKNYDDCQILHYEVSYVARYRMNCTANSGNGVLASPTRKTVSVTGTKTYIDNLLSYSKYELTVVAVVQTDFGLIKGYSSVHEFATLSNEPLPFSAVYRSLSRRGRLNKPRPTNVTSTQVILNFNEYLYVPRRYQRHLTQEQEICKLLNGPFLYYMFTVQDLYRNETRFIEVPVCLETELLLYDLEPRTEYNISYAWYNDVAATEPSEPVIIKTPNDIPDPPQLRILNTNETRVKTIRSVFPKYPKAKLLQLEIECYTGSETHSGQKLLKFRRILETEEYVDINVMVVDFIQCNGILHSDKGPSMKTTFNSRRIEYENNIELESSLK